MLVTGSSIYQGSSEISKVFQGTALVWQKENGPAWPGDYYYPNFNFESNVRGIGFWLSTIMADTNRIYFTSDDCEGESGDRMFVSQTKTAISPLIVTDNGSSFDITTQSFAGKNWLMPYSHYEARYDTQPSFWNNCTALCYRRDSASCGSLLRFSSNIDCSGVVLLVDLSPKTVWGEGISFSNLVERCSNLQYIALNKNGTNTGQTFTLTGSTAWTADSMKFTEWYCPGTTFIIENNSWWRSRIDWEIATERNITFKDPNGNIITQ